ncbi:MAG: hypothetical protein LBH98_01470 [Chitinispirillales bacterium]|nr:hypothetical protein [Chitinispirillales bacterium]
MRKIELYLFIFFISKVLVAQGVNGLRLPTPDVNVLFGIGFNYDYLKSPFDVDFETAKGFYSVNIPVRFTLEGESVVDEIFSNVSENFTDGEYFMPNMSARQYANTTIKVDVPMLWGVCSFSHVNVMSMRYENMTGIPSFGYYSKVDNDFDLFLSGNINTPLNFSLGWESMSFGYVYKFKKLAMVGLNLHRHHFYFRAGGNINIDMSGHVLANLQESELKIPFRYSLKNPISGEYSLERWTPSFAMRIWNFDFFAKIMFTDYAKGALSGSYAVPFFVDASNFTINEKINTADYIIENIQNNNFMDNGKDTVYLYTNNNIKWQLPSVLTLKYCIIPDHLWISYSKFIGKTSLELVDKSFSNETEFLKDGLDLRTNVRLDHLILLNGKVGWFYGSLGIISINADFQNERNLLKSKDADFFVPYGNGVMLPTLSGGGIIGTKLQFLLELNLLPLTALKTGLVYNF